MILCFVFFFKDFIYLFLERGEGEEKGGESNINVWLRLERSLLGTWPATQACALTRNWTSGPLVHRPAPSPLSHSSQGCGIFIYLFLNVLVGCSFISCCEVSFEIFFFWFWMGCYVFLSLNCRRFSIYPGPVLLDNVFCTYLDHSMAQLLFS